jgi:DNA (cytosine-5)-methyltransferase 1
MKSVKTFIDLFCGCGGMSHGFMEAGYKALLGVDNDSKALDTYVLNHKGSKAICGDIRNVTAKQITEKIGTKKIDVLIGGVPCQSVSLSGHRKADDPRNELFFSYTQILKNLKPKAFVLENVPGLVGLFGGQLKDALLEAFSKCGYTTSYKILTASAYGVPQTRRRVFFVGLLNSKDEFQFPEGSEKIINCEDAISDLPECTLEDGSKYIISPKSGYQKMMRKRSPGVFNHYITHHSEKTVEIISLVPDGKNYKSLPENLRETRKVNIAWTRLNSTKPSFTIDTGHRHHFHYKYNRVPTVRESARIQSFPDSFVFTGNKTSQYRQVGNAVPPMLAEAIAEKLTEYLK